MSEKMFMKHPDETKAGTNIDRNKYDVIHAAILDTLESSGSGETDFKILADEVGKRVPNFDGSIGWYTTTVKLHMEAIGEIERVPNSTPQRLRMATH